ncbi:hypothetical protein UY3_12493 [Chelonia mydas]|uniref:Uncharacterized protein n=1 Tax=Chelonia mydas TaxID=8469 RepID=M7BQG6_CHEMY|nr:hypothetical protein UY3_12493 [Chelonia mydas]
MSLLRLLRQGSQGALHAPTAPSAAPAAPISLEPHSRAAWLCLCVGAGAGTYRCFWELFELLLIDVMQKT